ncbi:MAG: UDP-N-acetylglucosamine 2-epimerase (non-hydrolyzing) [Nitrospirae bacterium]|nr:MAG: UDP-N-acetylglucosamine 2-epimerase (non-hydrolyzing) [Nitrospirota bacterium]
MLILGTRPEAIKLFPVLQALQRRQDKFRALLCVTGQHREMVDQMLDLFEVKPDYDLSLMTENQTLTEISARALTAVRSVLFSAKPDLVLIQGDTTTVMTAALAAYYEQIPVGHVEAGLRTGLKYAPFPEEINRRVVSVVADFHFTPTPLARKNLLAEGVRSDSIFVTGNTVVDALLEIGRRVKTPGMERTILSGLKAQLTPSCVAALTGDPGAGRIILVTCHRRESFGKPLVNVCTALRSLAERNPEVEIVYPVHRNPNVLNVVEAMFGGRKPKLSNVHLLRPVDYLTFVFLMLRSYFLLTDSGGIQEEAPTYGKPVLVLRDATERQEAIATGTARLVGTSPQRILRESERLLRDLAAYRSMIKKKNPFGDGHASERIADILCRKFRKSRKEDA